MDEAEEIISMMEKWHSNAFVIHCEDINVLAEAFQELKRNQKS